VVSSEVPKVPRRKRMRQLGWVAVLFFTLKGLAWLALGAGAWRLLQ
jgi:hypothetical protein